MVLLPPRLGHGAGSGLTPVGDALLAGSMGAAEGDVEAGVGMADDMSCVPFTPFGVDRWERLEMKRVSTGIL